MSRWCFELCHLSRGLPLAGGDTFAGPASPPPPHPLRVKTSSPGVNQKTHTVGSAACCAVCFCLEGMKTVVMHVMNKPGAAAASALRALCQRGVDMWSTLKVVFPFTSPSLPSLPSSSSPSSPGPWFQRVSSLLLFPVMAQDHRLPAFSLFFSWFSIPSRNAVLLSSHRRGSLAAERCCCFASPHRHNSVSECDSLKHPARHSSFVLVSVSSSSPAALGDS